MPNHHCPTIKDIDKANHEFKSARKNHIQQGRTKQDKYRVQAQKMGPDLIALWWTDKLHPKSGEPDFRPDAPNAIISAHKAPDAEFWTRAAGPKKRAVLIADAIFRIGGQPWPS